MEQKTKWLVMKETADGLVLLSEHNTEEDARSYWYGGSLKGEKPYVFKEVVIED